MMSPMKEGSCGVMVEGLSGFEGVLEVSEVGKLVGESSPSSSSERSRMNRSARADMVVVVVVVRVKVKLRCKCSIERCIRPVRCRREEVKAVNPVLSLSLSSS